MNRGLSGLLGAFACLMLVGCGEDWGADQHGANPHFSQPCALGRFDGRRSSQVAQAADSADFGQAPASALEQGACGRVDGV
ncbi:hypothetical protein [Stutzerimonas zhaodongensis]|uniref:Lipoprotein n=1 Tax=Stutzerimonas zhaodongensis TaxID=1176257 RepID=A0ABX8IUX7_9GAMM|nr:hypothetical protein [Stutzerimonas zhaodongensis]QWV16544.1 hypothetical protein KQ248_19025 [Stutzerimonas zhaodongensis]